MKTNQPTRKQPPARKQAGVWKPPSSCLGCGDTAGYSKKTIPCEMQIRGELFIINDERWVCASCNEAFAGPGQTDTSLRFATMAYQDKHGILTADKIREKRKQLGWTQANLAERAGVGIASIKRWEKGTGVQTSANNRAIVDAFAQTRHSQASLGQITVVWSMPRCSIPDPADWWKQAEAPPSRFTCDSFATYDETMESCYA